MTTADWELTTPATAAEAPADLVAAVARWDLHVGDGADASLLDLCSTRLLERVFGSDDDAARSALLARAGADPAFRTRLLRDILPAVARRLGCGWAEDRLSFVDVTIACARIQEAVHRLGHVAGRPHADAVAVVVPPWEQHTLSATFAADGLRRLGTPARLVAGRTSAQIVSVLSRAPFAAAFVSVGSEAARARVPALLTALRKGRSRPMPLIAGGAGARRGRRIDGADLVTDDLSEALDFCRIAAYSDQDAELVPHG